MIFCLFTLLPAWGGVVDACCRLVKFVGDRLTEYRNGIGFFIERKLFVHFARKVNSDEGSHERFVDMNEFADDIFSLFDEQATSDSQVPVRPQQPPP